MAVDRTDVELMTDLGAAYEASDRLSDAEATYRRALEIDPHDGVLLLRLGRLLLRRGDAVGARAHAAAAVRWMPGNAEAVRLEADASRAAGARDAPQ